MTTNLITIDESLISVRKDGVEVGEIRDCSSEDETVVYLDFITNGTRTFAARFKYGFAMESAQDFAVFLFDHFTIDEFIGHRQDGLSPLAILETKGYVSYNVRRSMEGSMKNFILIDTGSGKYVSLGLHTGFTSNKSQATVFTSLPDLSQDRRYNWMKTLKPVNID